MARWLQAEIISDSSRPKPLEESVCTFEGNCKVRVEDKSGIVLAPTTEHLRLSLYQAQPKRRRSANELSKRDAVVLELAQFHLNQKHRVLIFQRSTKDKTVTTAKRLAERVRRSDLEPVELVEQLRNMEDDDVIPTFLSELLPAGIAFHNGSLSADLRETIELSSGARRV